MLSDAGWKSVAASARSAGSGAVSYVDAVYVSGRDEAEDLAYYVEVGMEDGDDGDSSVGKASVGVSPEWCSDSYGSESEAVGGSAVSE